MATGNMWEPSAAADRMLRAAGLQTPRPAVQSTNHLTAMTLLAHSDMLSLTQRLILERPP